MFEEEVQIRPYLARLRFLFHIGSGGRRLILLACSSVTGHQLPNSVNQYSTFEGSIPNMMPLWFVSTVICMLRKFGCVLCFVSPMSNGFRANLSLFLELIELTYLGFRLERHYMYVPAPFIALATLTESLDCRGLSAEGRYFPPTEPLDLIVFELPDV
jgi:hypothetical protein